MIKSGVCWGVWILCVGEVAVKDVGRGIVVGGIADYVRFRMSAGEDRELSVKPRAWSICAYLTEFGVLVRCGVAEYIGKC